MTEMTRSYILYRLLFVLFIVLVIVVFTVPQPVLDSYEMFFLLVMMPLMGWMWIQAYVDASRGN